MLETPFYYNPLDWYWGPDQSGKYFASARKMLVAAGDPTFVAWQATGNKPTPWPKDDAGNKSSAALQDVLLPYGIPVAPAGLSQAQVLALAAAVEAHVSAVLQKRDAALAGIAGGTITTVDQVAAAFA